MADSRMVDVLQLGERTNPVVRVEEPEEKRSFFECFPYVCPEPVLVK